MKEKVPYLKLFSSRVERRLPETLAYIEDLARSSDFILGAPVRDFERTFADFAGAKFAIGVNSGLDALILSLKALEIGPGDEVITVPNSFVASASAIALVGAKPVFVDVGEDYNLDVSSAEAVITSRTKAILPVHLTGNPCDMDPLMRLCADRGLKLIEDAAQAVGARYRGKAVGTFGDTGCFSLHPLKNMHAWGDGGLVVTSSDEVAEKLCRLRNHGLKSRDQCLEYSFNSRLDSLQAIIALQSLRDLDEVTAARRKNAEYLRKGLASIPQLSLPIEKGEAFHVYHVFQVRCESRDALSKYLSDHGVETKIHYPIPLHLQPAARYLGYERGAFPMAERLACEILSLPIHEDLTTEDLDTVSGRIREFYSSSKG